jgi:hypothetical protein
MAHRSADHSRSARSGLHILRRPAGRMRMTLTWIREFPDRHTGTRWIDRIVVKA